MIESEPEFRGQPFTIEIPTAALRGTSSVEDLGIFLSIGEAWAQLALHFSGSNAPRVLDIGCGCGKMARFLYLNPLLSYVGLDAYRPAIEWCRQAFYLASDRFRFEHLDVIAPSYNESGSMSAESVTLPVESHSADMIIAASLFTHLSEAAFRRYLEEIARCVRDAGRVLISIHNEPGEGRFTATDFRTDIADEYFEAMTSSVGLLVFKRLENVFGQKLYVLTRAQA
jgi:SAM-dependent methyltransferase